jgi:enamine deaminase RidA (YjgF/YER057c/UK114 family)
MASIKRIQPSGLHVRSAGGRALYSHVIVAEGQRFVFVAGQVARDAQGAVVGRGDMRTQLRQVCENMRIALAAAGARPSDLVQTTTYVTDIETFFRHTDVRTEFFGPEPPASTTVEVRRLAHQDFLIEMDGIAVVGGGARAATSAPPRRPPAPGKKRRP